MTFWFVVVGNFKEHSVKLLNKTKFMLQYQYLKAQWSHKDHTNNIICILTITHTHAILTALFADPFFLQQAAPKAFGGNWSLTGRLKLIQFRCDRGRIRTDDFDLC